MKKTEYFMVQTLYNQLPNGLVRVKKLRDDFISNSSIEKVADESIETTFLPATNEMIFIITLTYY
jgi:hypothetical protein